MPDMYDILHDGILIVLGVLSSSVISKDDDDILASYPPPLTLSPNDDIAE